MTNEELNKLLKKAGFTNVDSIVWIKCNKGKPGRKPKQTLTDSKQTK